MNTIEWKIYPNVWFVDWVHFPIIFCLHEQVDGTVSFSSFNCFSLLEALQGVHRAREECKEIRRNFSARNILDMSY